VEKYDETPSSHQSASPFGEALSFVVSTIKEKGQYNARESAS
jgi:hypothetical protein